MANMSFSGIVRDERSFMELTHKLASYCGGPIVNLDLSCCKLFRESHLRRFADFFVTGTGWSHLEILDLSNNGLQTEHVDDILRIVRACRFLKHLLLEKNNLDEIGVTALLSKLSSMAIYLDGNPFIPMQLCIKLLPDLCPKLMVSLDFHENRVSAVGHRTSFWAFFSCSYGFGTSPAQQFFKRDGDKRIQHKIWDWLKFHSSITPVGHHQITQTALP
jgi:hypothetical protein